MISWLTLVWRTARAECRRQAINSSEVDVASFRPLLSSRVGMMGPRALRGNAAVSIRGC